MREGEQESFPRETCLTLTDKSGKLSIRLVIEATRISQPEAARLRLYIHNDA